METKSDEKRPLNQQTPVEVADLLSNNTVNSSPSKQDEEPEITLPKRSHVFDYIYSAKNNKQKVILLILLLWLLLSSVGPFVWMLIKEIFSI